MLDLVSLNPTPGVSSLVSGSGAGLVATEVAAADGAEVEVRRLLLRERLVLHRREDRLDTRALTSRHRGSQKGI